MKINRKQLGSYDWIGNCDPTHTARAATARATFSVGIFRWIAKSNLSGLKRGPVVLRIKGDTTNPQAVYKAAENYCNRLDRGERLAFKTLNMGFS